MNDRVHCPDCGAEYRAGYTICTECGGLLQPGATPEGFEEQPADGGGERVAGVRFAYRADTDDASARASPSDLFEGEERPPTRLILAVMVEEDAPGLIDALGAEGIGTRLGERTPDGGVEVLIHDTNLAAAQAVLVDYTGDPSLVDAVVEAESADEEVGDDPSSRSPPARSRGWRPRSSGSAPRGSRYASKREAATIRPERPAR